MNKNEYLKQEKKQSEQSKERIDSIGADYMQGYRNGYNKAYSDVIEYLEYLYLLYGVAELSKYNYEDLNMADSISKKINGVNKECLNLNDLKIYNKNVSESKATNLKIKERIDMIRKIGASQEYLNGIRELGYSMDFALSIHEAIGMIEEYKYTDDEINVLLKLDKLNIDCYNDPNEEIAEKLDIAWDDFYKIDKIYNQKFSEKQLLKLYKNRENMNKCIGA